MVVLTNALTIYDFVTDILFVFSLRSGEYPLFIASIVFVVAP